MATTTRRYALLDALDPLPLPARLDDLRRLVNAQANIAITDEGIELGGLWSRTVRWDRIQKIELASRLDGLLMAGLTFTPLVRIPRARGLVQRAVVGGIERLAPAQVEAARERLGWSIVQFHHKRGETEVRRLPAIVARLYPSLSRQIVDEATARDIPIERRDPTP